MRSVSAVVIIEKSTGDIIWHLDSTVVAQQHCANELPNGNILVSLKRELRVAPLQSRQLLIAARSSTTVLSDTARASSGLAPSRLTEQPRRLSGSGTRLAR
jgi:hypothetical protein